MCGIAGILARNADAPGDLAASLARLRHRGPDDEGTWGDRHVSLGHTRLAILDLSSLGHQPMTTVDGRYVITFNGEIYNYLELREVLEGLGHRFRSRSDTEVLLEAYARWGEACLQRLRGMFAFAVWDTREKKIFLARDRVGEKPLYYFLGRDALYFASEMKALLSLLPFRPDLDPDAVDLYFHYQYVPEPGTALAGIRKLQAGHFLQVDHGSWEAACTRYWSLDRIEPVEGDPGELIRAELSRSIELTLRSDVPVGIALSGGLDSTAITTLASSRYQETLHAFSVGYPGRPDQDERRYARALSESLGLPFHDVELGTDALAGFFPALVGIMDDPIADIAAFGHYSVMRAAADHSYKVVLTGIGGDELFWGYPWVSEAVRLTEQKRQRLREGTQPPGLRVIEKLAGLPLSFILANNRRLPGRVRTLFQKVISLGKMDLRRPERAVYQNLVPDFEEALNDSPGRYHPRFAEQIRPHNPFRLFEVDGGLPGDIPTFISQLLFDSWLASNCLALGDRVSMASSVESRMPLLDYALIELVFGLRKAHPDHAQPEKYFFRSALKGVLPEETLNRPKRGFQPPVREWMGAVIRTYGHWLLNSVLADMNVVSREYIHERLKRYKARGTGMFMLYKLLLLEIWYRSVIMGEC